MSKIQVNDIVNHYDTGAPQFPKGIAVGSGATLGLNVGTGASIYSPSDNVLTLGTNNAERLRIAADGTTTVGPTSGIGITLTSAGAITAVGNIVTSGDIGIGAATPAASLQIKKTSAGGDPTHLLLSNVSAVEGTTSSIYFAPNLVGSIRSAKIVGINENGGNSTALTFSTNPEGNPPEERMRIDSSGRIGIGTDNPQYPLVVGSGTDDALNVDTLSAGSGVVLRSYDAHKTDYEPFGIAAEYVNFYTRIGTNSSTERMRIDSSGTVKINSPSYSSPAQLQLDAKDNTAYAPPAVYPSNQIEIQNSVSMGSAIMRFRSQSSNGSAGIWNMGAVPRTASLVSDFVFQSRTADSTYNEIARFSGSGGILFNGDTAAANALDDYEEGTFTVTSTGILNQGGLQTASYIKIGSQVTYMFNFYQNSNNMSWSAGSFFSISAFTPIANFHTSPSISWFKSSSSSDTQPAYFNSAGDIVLNSAQSSVRHLWGFVTIQVQ